MKPSMLITCCKLFLVIRHLYAVYDLSMYVSPLREIIFVQLTIVSSTDGFKGWAKMVLRDGWKCTSIIKL